jgi:hypothetical protein
MELILRSTFESLGSSDLLGCTTPNDVVTNVNHDDTKNPSVCSLVGCALSFVPAPGQMRLHGFLKNLY